MNAVWFVAVEAPGRRAEWDWTDLGSPNPHDLYPVRLPSSGDFSRHIPVTAYSVTTGSHHELESGLENDLLRELDRRGDIVHLLAQPVLLHFPHASGRTSHTPDLLSMHADRSVGVWDARPHDHRDELFERKSNLAAAACADVGWTYHVFTGHTRTARMNLLWLSGFKRPMPWHAARAGELRELLAPRPGVLGAVVGTDDGTGELISTMWHLIWTGDIACNLEQRIEGSTAVTWAVS